MNFAINSSNIFDIDEAAINNPDFSAVLIFMELIELLKEPTSSSSIPDSFAFCGAFD
jgi:hypothetical protein